MLEEMLIRYCAPTLAGLKTGSLFRCAFSSTDALCAQIRYFNRRLAGKGLRILPLKFGEKTALIYVYRPAKLQSDLSAGAASALLKENGYVCCTPSQYISHLIGRLREQTDFPHEIGLFLGYPPEDVRGFIENQAQRCKYVGCWKVYGDEKKARQLFERYKKCTEIYTRCHGAGRSLDKLTIPM